MVPSGAHTAPYPDAESRTTTRAAPPPSEVTISEPGNPVSYPTDAPSGEKNGDQPASLETPNKGLPASSPRGRKTSPSTKDWYTMARPSGETANPPMPIRVPDTGISNRPRGRSSAIGRSQPQRDATSSSTARSASGGAARSRQLLARPGAASAARGDESLKAGFLSA